MYGCTAVIPSDVFLAEAGLQALAQEKCTVIHAVPTMFQALLDHPETSRYAPEICLRTGIIAGASFSGTMMERLSAEFGFRGLSYGYGKRFLMTRGCTEFLEQIREPRLTLGRDDRALMYCLHDCTVRSLSLG